MQRRALSDHDFGDVCCTTERVLTPEVRIGALLYQCDTAIQPHLRCQVWIRLACHPKSWKLIFTRCRTEQQNTLSFFIEIRISSISLILLLVLHSTRSRRRLKLIAINLESVSISTTAHITRRHHCCLLSAGVSLNTYFLTHNVCRSFTS